MNRIQSFTSALLTCVIVHGLTGCSPAAELPFDSTHPLIYDNDTELEGLDLPYAAALASAGEIRLVAVTYLIAHDYPAFMNIVRRSGLDHIPEVPSLAENRVPDVINSETIGLVLSRPASGLIEDTVPVINASVRAIVQQARLATPESHWLLPPADLSPTWPAPIYSSRVSQTGSLSAAYSVPGQTAGTIQPTPGQNMSCWNGYAL